MDTTTELNLVLAQAKEMGVKIVPKTGWFWGALAWGLKVISFGKMPDFQTQFVTTIYKTIGVPTDWDSWSDLDKLEVLTHELTHVRQNMRYTPILFSILYLLLPLPLGLAYFRYKFEREAYVNGYEVLIRNGYDRSQLIDRVVANLSGPDYLWAWPAKWVRAWFEKNLPSV